MDAKNPTQAHQGGPWDEGQDEIFGWIKGLNQAPTKNWMVLDRLPELKS
jgi:hypothetical protein